MLVSHLINTVCEWSGYCFRYDRYICTDYMEGIDVHYWQRISCCCCSFWKHGAGLQEGNSFYQVNSCTVLYPAICLYNALGVSSTIIFASKINFC